MHLHFSDLVITHILEQSIIYSCACPAQVCKAIRGQRELYNYQKACLNASETDKAVHQAIADAVASTHAQLEACLERVLLLEGWDMGTYRMPESLQKKILQELSH